MQTQLLPLGNLVHVAQGRDVEMVLVDGEIVVEDARPLKVDRMPSDATQTPRSARSGRGRAPARHMPVASQRRRS
jgi:5-methylthioadenosine/S-adenosylhomocysteine deaminase